MRTVGTVTLEGKDANKNQHGAVGHEVRGAPHADASKDESEEGTDDTDNEHPLVCFIHRVAPAELTRVHALAQIRHVDLKRNFWNFGTEENF